MRTLFHNPALFLSRHRPVERVADFHGTNSISPSEFVGAVATLSSRTRGDGTSSNAPKGKPRMRTLFHNPRLFLAGHRPGAPGCGLAWNQFLTEQRVRIRRRRTGPANQLRGVTTCRSGASARAAPDRWRPLSAQQPRYPPVRKGMERALTRRKGSPACELFSIIRGCSLPVIVPVRQGPGSLERPSGIWQGGAKFGKWCALWNLERLV